MPARLLPLLVAALVAATLLGQPTASAAPRAAAVASSDALERAQALFAEKSPVAARRQAVARPDATLALNQLLKTYPDLSASDREVADQLLARPTRPGGDGTVSYQTAEAPPVCSAAAATPICVHYVTTTEDAPALTDTTPLNGIPDEVDRALATAESVHTTYVTSGYRRPDPDGAAGGGSDTVDLYLGQLGDRGIYGYCTSDQPPKKNGTGNLWAYCVIDNDYDSSEFPAHTATENQQVTLAHEYFHAVQYAYDAFEDNWILEATATWAEEQLFDDINDNRQYLAASQIALPTTSLDRFAQAGYQYGSWIFVEFLTDRWPAETGSMPTLVLELWERMQARSFSDPDAHSTQALQGALAARGASFTRIYGQFADGNRRPATTYTEGDAAEYAPAAPAAIRTLSATKRSTPEWIATLDHLSSLTVRLQPQSGLTQGDWKLRVKVDLPPKLTAPVARLAVYAKDGSVTSSALPFKRRGFSTKVVGFKATDVRYVELVLANASLRKPRDNGVRFALSARLLG